MSRPLICLAILAAPISAVGQELLTTDDGISLRGTVRLLKSNAATCNVLEANEPSYEEKRVNQDQPLHLWELEFSVFNGSGRPLDHLIAYYDIASPWPPCTNWTENYELEGDYVYLQVQWADPSGHIQQTGAATPTLPNQTHTETILLLAFNGVRPQFTDWSVNYTFMEGQVASAAVAAEAPVASAPALPSDLLCVEASDKPCWMELENVPDCYVWNPAPADLRIVSWLGQCSSGFGTGTGTYSHEYAESIEIPYVSGKIHGTRIERWADGTVNYLPYVDGERHGTHVFRRADGGVIESPYVNGELHGTEVYRFAGGDVLEVPWVNGEKHGMEIERWSNGDVYETPYVNGEIHGTRVYRYASGTVSEVPWVNDERHGTAISRRPDGRVFETRWVNGEEGERRCVAGCN